MVETMTSLIIKLFTQNWQRKFVALISAFILWIFINNSITETKVVPNIPIRVINLPSDKTISGLLPNRILTKRVTLTLTGRKDVIQDIEPSDLEVILDASQADGSDWVAQITKKNLISLNPKINLSHHITTVWHIPFVIKLSSLVTAKVPVRCIVPIGDPPSGYEYLDIWPQKLKQTVSGPAEEIQKLKNKGLELVLNLSEITKADLDVSQTSSNNEISFPVPDKWKKILVPFTNPILEELNDPEAKNLRITFLKKEFLPLEIDLAIDVFYPLKTSESINPATYPLEASEFVKKNNDLLFLSFPVYAYDVSRVFLNIVKENIALVIVAGPKTEREKLQWSVEVFNPYELEDTYVAVMMNNSANKDLAGDAPNKRKEYVLRKRFRDYLQKLTLYKAPNQKLAINPMLGINKIEVTQVN